LGARGPECRRRRRRGGRRTDTGGKSRTILCSRYILYAILYMCGCVDSEYEY
jgi:hypothetical protein